MLLRFGGVLFIVMLALWLYCLLDAITSDENQVRSLPKVVWVLIVLFTFEIGAVLWLLFGRPRRSAGASPGPGRARRVGRGDAWSSWPRSSDGTGRADRPAPDDDPDFLAGLDRQVNDKQKRLLDKWEADLRRREEELRRRENGDEGSARPDDQAR
jgi:Phospholipase_D-nuclease N-terminal